MKLIIITVFLFSTISCKQEVPEEAIAKEIVSLTKEYNGAWDKLNMENVAKFHSDSSFRYYRYGALAVSNNEEFRKMAPMWMEGIKNLEAVEFSDPVVQVLSENAAIISFKGVAKVVLKNGNEELESNTATYVWQKRNNEWKIVHIHESKK